MGAVSAPVRRLAGRARHNSPEAVMEKSKIASGVSAAGRSIQEIISEELDDTMDELMEDGSGAEPESKGYARGLAFAMAVYRNPYDIEGAMAAVREEAVERWEERDTG